LIGVVLVGMTGFGVFLPVFPFLALHVGATPAQATWAMGAYSLGQLIAAPLWGAFSDRVGRKPVLIAGLLGAMLSYLWLARAGSVLDVAGARLFAGLMAGNIGAAFAAAADLADDKTRARNMGLLGAAVGFAFIAGPFFGAMLAGDDPDAAGFARICYAAAGFALIAALGALFLFRETLARGAAPVRAASQGFALMMRRPALARLAAVMLLMIAAQAMMETTFGLWADIRLDWGPRQVGWALAGLGLLGALLQGGGAGAASRILGERMTLALGLVIFAAGFGGLAAANQAPATIVALGAIAIGAGLSGPALQSLFAAQSAPNELGASMGLSQSASALGRVIGPAVAGFAFGGFGSSAPYLIGALVLLAALMAATGAPAPDHARGMR
jgi:MFS family permease